MRLAFELLALNKLSYWDLIGLSYWALIGLSYWALIELSYMAPSDFELRGSLISKLLGAY